MRKLAILSAIFTALLAVGAAPSPRVVSLSPALTELVFQLGRGDALVGRSAVCNYPDAVLRLPVAGRFADATVERVLALRPDLLLTNDLINPGVIRPLERAGVRVVMRQCRNIADYEAWVELAGKWLNAPEAARAELGRVAAEKTRLQKLKPLPLKVLWVIWDAPLMVAGGRSLPDEFLKLAGVENVAGRVAQEYFKCSRDWLLEQQPDVIVWGAGGGPDKSAAFWGELAAVREKRVITGLDPDLVCRPGPRCFAGIMLLRKELERYVRP